MSEDIKFGILVLTGLVSILVILFVAINIDQNRKTAFLQECIKAHQPSECLLLTK